MKNINIKLKNLRNLVKPKRLKGISPIIAVLLMIGLTVTSGALLFAVSTAFVSQETQVNLNIDSNSVVFKSTETDYRFVDDLVDTLSLQIENPLEQSILVDLSQTFLYNSADQRIDNWTVISNVNEIVLNGKESTTITFGTYSSSSQLTNGEEIYVVFQSKLYNSKGEFESLKTSPLTVELTNSGPLFQVIPEISASQTEDTLYFAGQNDEEVFQNLTFAIFNYGNANQAYGKTVSITLENTTIFSIADGFDTQSVTVPGASKGGD